MKTLNDVINWLISSGALTAFFVFAWKYAKPFLDEKATHASTDQSRTMWSLLETVADTAVSALVSKQVAGSLKYDTATQQVQEEMAKQGFTVDQKTAGMAVQSAYEKSPLTPAPHPTQGTATAIDTTKEGK